MACRQVCCSNIYVLTVSYCIIYICRAWKNKIRSAKPENQKELYQTLCNLASENDPEVFESRMAQFDKVWSSDEPEFVKYFHQNYENRTGRHIDN